jgi:hypothetical protein
MPVACMEIGKCPLDKGDVNRSDMEILNNILGIIPLNEFMVKRREIDNKCY